MFGRGGGALFGILAARTWLRRSHLLRYIKPSARFQARISGSRRCPRRRPAWQPAHRGLGHALLSQLFVNLAALRVEQVETVVKREDFGLLGFFYDAGFGQSQRLSFDKRVA